MCVCSLFNSILRNEVLECFLSFSQEMCHTSLFLLSTAKILINNSSILFIKSIWNGTAKCSFSHSKIVTKGTSEVFVFVEFYYTNKLEVKRAKSTAIEEGVCVFKTWVQPVESYTCQFCDICRTFSLWNHSELLLGKVSHPLHVTHP